ncbi:MAG: energy transducer TonB [Treponema sp.]|jgi:protein TonB|nr:energy transducer TonB [Treponema sp.]
MMEAGSRLAAINRMRLALFLLVAALHGFLIFFLVFHLETTADTREPEAKIMKLADIQEELPPPLPLPPPPPLPPRPPAPQQIVEAIAETMVETDEVPQDQVIVESLPYEAPPQPVQSQSRDPEYLPQHRVSKVPVFSEGDIRKNLVYPPIALRSNVEGVVILALFVDAQGEIRRITVLKEEPSGRGFGEAAVKAFQGIRASSPAEANGVAVGVQYRYPIRFAIK